MASVNVKTYDPKKYIITFNGVALTGFADGTFISVTPSNQRWNKTVGADGEVGRSRSNDDTYEVSITLMHTSLSNSVLNTFKEADRLTNSGMGALSITDLNGSTVLFWYQAWIRQSPDIEQGKEISERTWVFDTGQVTTETVAGQAL